MTKIYFLICILLSPLIFAKKSCSEISEQQKKISAEILFQKTKLQKLRKQIDSNKIAIDQYNKNCQNASGPKCQPAMYSMFISQMPIYEGQQSEIADRLAKSDKQMTEINKKYVECAKK